jgi:hypothetical protein
MLSENSKESPTADDIFNWFDHFVKENYPLTYRNIQNATITLNQGLLP